MATGAGLAQLQVWTLWVGLGSLLCKSSPSPAAAPCVLGPLGIPCVGVPWLLSHVSATVPCTGATSATCALHSFSTETHSHPVSKLSALLCLHRLYSFPPFAGVRIIGRMAFYTQVIRNGGLSNGFAV